ncbi:MAG TPA: aminoglycoside phosphotransferase family protein [Longimicrobium sp.]
MIRVPEAFARAAVIRDGEAGRRWIGELPGIVEDLCGRWNLAVDGAPMHGYLALAVPVMRGGERCVLKVSWSDESTVDEAVALQAWDGRGAVRLLAWEPARTAMLLERLDSARSLAGLPVEEAVPIAGRLLRRLAIAAPDGVRPLRAVGGRLSETLVARWERYGRPLPRRTLDLARELAAGLGARAAGLLVNYDLHYDDVLGGGHEPWLAIDPKVVAGDAEYGLAQLLWCRLEEMEARGGVERHFHALAEAAELDRGLARSWTLVRCVDYWLWGLGAGLTDDPARCARIIDRLGLGVRETLP